MRQAGVDSPIRVLVIDDSALMRAVLTEIIDGARDLQVVGAAPDALAARSMIELLDPDVLTLDVEMPKMSGLEFLERLMRSRPMPVVMISAFTERGSYVTLRALEIGAVDFVTKPGASNAVLSQAYAEEVRDKIRAARGARLRQPAAGTKMAASAPGAGSLSPRLLTERLIAIGASTGGTEAIREVLGALPEEVPGIVIAQHMPESFTGSFARRLDSLCRVRVTEACGGELIEPGHAYLAPGHSHLLVKRFGARYMTELSQAAPVNRHRPSVDALFASVAAEAGRNAVGIILTGMGKDGARGMLEMKKAGAWNIGQDEQSCVVYGMPREAARAGALDEVSPLGEIADRAMARLRQRDGSRQALY